MKYVTTVIFSLTSLALLLGCGPKEIKSNPDLSILPSKIDVPHPGILSYIEPEALVEKLNNGENLQMVFLKEFPVIDSVQYIPNLPGMIELLMGEMFYYINKIDKNRPLYLLCMYGDDSKRIGADMIKEGVDVYYLDGGTYRLVNEMRSGKIRLNPKSK